MPNLVTADELSILEQISGSGKPMHARRARLLLLNNEGLNPQEISHQVELSDRQVRHWISAFREQRLGVFPAKVIAAAGPIVSAPSPDEPEKNAGEADEGNTFRGEIASPAELPGAELTVAELCQRYAIDIPHAEHVARAALTLFDATQETHRIAPRWRSLLETAAILHDVGLAFYPAQHHTAGRDIILQHRITDLSELDQQILACTTAFHRKRFRPRRLTQEPSFLVLPQEVRDLTLALAAIVRLADGLDYSQSQTSSLLVDSFQVWPAGPTGHRIFTLPLTGSSAAEDAARAQYKADMWQHLFDTQLEFVPIEPGQLSTTKADTQQDVWVSTLAAATGISPEDAMSEAGRKTLRLHFARMLEHEAGTRLGVDIEELHDMRVATRRMRSAFDVFAPYFDPKALQPHVKRLRRIGRALGRVRDLDVFMEKAQHYLESVSEDVDVNLEPLLEDWKARRETSREQMIATLDSGTYRHFVEEFTAFVTTPGAGAFPQPVGRPAANQIYQIVPTLVYGRYEIVRGYEPLLHDAPLDILHALRVDFKRLRYTLEFFREVLGPEVETVIKEVVTVQDHLGNLNDADVACSLLIQFLEQWSKSERRDRIDIGGVAHYLLAKQAELRELVSSFPKVWANFNRPDLRRNMALAVSAL